MRRTLPSLPSCACPALAAVLVLALPQTGRGSTFQGSAQERASERSQQERADAIRKALLEGLCGARSKTLKGVILGFHEYEKTAGKAKPRQGKRGEAEAHQKDAHQEPAAAAASSSTWRLRCKVSASLGFDDRFRLEYRDPEGREPGRIYLQSGSRVEVGSPGGPFLQLGGAAEERFHDRTRLLACLLGWDLLDEDWKPRVLQAEGVQRLVSLLPKSLGSEAERRIERQLKPRDDAGIDMTAFQLGKTRFVSEGRIQGTGGSIPKTLLFAGGTRKLVFTRYVAGYSFTKERFQSGSGAGANRQWVQEQESRNFRAAKLERLTAAHELVLEDPGAWEKRFELLGTLGMDLYRLGQNPAGLPVYTSTGKLLLAYQADKTRAGKPGATPKGRVSRVRKPGVVAVLYTKGTWAEAKERLSRRLIRFLKEHGLKPAGPLRLIPYALPGGPAPKAGSEILFRAELKVRQ